MTDVHGAAELQKVTMDAAMASVKSENRTMLMRTLVAMETKQYKTFESCETRYMKNCNRSPLHLDC